MLEREVEFEAGNIKLAGTLCLPNANGRFPSVLMIHGTGPMDRDENMPIQKLDIFNTFAHHLAEAGIASLRYDKRGCGRSGGNYHTAGHFDLVADASAAFQYLRQSETSIPQQVFALGHSEGTIIAPQLSLKHPELAGLILICPFAQPVETILMQQAHSLQESFAEMKGFQALLTKVMAKIFGDTLTVQKRLITRIKSSQTPTFRHGFSKIEAKALRELIELDPQAIYNQVTCPMLVIGGEKDLQCDPNDVHLVANLAQAPVEAHVIKDLNHILRLDFEKPSFLSYAKLLKEPIERSVLELMSTWLNGQSTIQRQQ